MNAEVNLLFLKYNIICVCCLVKRFNVFGNVKGNDSDYLCKSHVNYVCRTCNLKLNIHASLSC